MFSSLGMTPETFLREYWQRKPLLIPKALAPFSTPISGDELAGLAMEEEIESRLIWQSTDNKSSWNLKYGPFKNKDFKQLPASHWTLLVQGVDRFVPEIYALIEKFDFLPTWRFDDVMISYAIKEGGVGPHYDNYDVFLFQAQGKRRWQLSTKNCTPENYLDGLPLRIMKQFDVEEEYVLEPGDMLYLPPHVAHNGVSLTDDCMTFSFGYRSYQAPELWDNLADYVLENQVAKGNYLDPDLSQLKSSGEIPENAWEKARDLLLPLLNNKKIMQDWFGCLVSRLDQQAEDLFDANPEVENLEFPLTETLMRNPLSRFAYYEDSSDPRLFLNGEPYLIDGVSFSLIRKIADARFLTAEAVNALIQSITDQAFVNALWLEGQLVSVRGDD